MVLVKEGSNIRLYVNGNLSASGNIGTHPVNGTNLLIGVRDTNGAFGCYASISNLLIYDFALTAEEVYAA